MSADDSVTPMMAQYLDIKSGYRDALLFYRMGDFYEMFFEDAVAAAEALDIALTKRGKHLGEDIPMCGVPVHAAESYLLTLIRKGFRVAIAEQMEDPAEAKKRGSKAVVRRDVVRLVTPGTLTEENLLEARRHNFLAAFCEVRGEGALAWVDISTGAFRVAPCAAPRLGPELARLMPSEVLVPEGLEPSLAGIVSESGAAVTPLARASFDSTSAEGRLRAALGVGTLDAFGAFGRAEVGAMGAIVAYLELTQRGRLPLLRPPQREVETASVQIDAATRRNLELTRALSGGREGSLLNAIDRTVTAGGGRLLERRIAGPSRDLRVIHERLARLDALMEAPELRGAVRAKLRAVPDIDRALSRLALERGGPRDLAAIRNGLAEGAAVAGLLPEVFVDVAGALRGHEELVALLDAAIIAEPPLLARDGGFIAAGYDAELDEARELRDEGRGVIAGMQAEYVQATGIGSLKIRHNNVLGYFIETTATHAERMLSPPLSETFIHRQTIANAVRFTTVPLSEMETRILNAGERALEIEKRIYSSLSAAVLERAEAIAAAAAALAEVDVAAALAELAAVADWVRPVVDDSRVFLVGPAGGIRWSSGR
jgi:DNA mismatch repair protein MutS